MRKLGINISLLVLSLFLSISVVEISFSEVTIIVNPENTISSLSREELKRIYQGKMQIWKGGGKIKAADMKKEEEARKRFSNIVMGKPPKAVERYYLKRSLAGKGQPPRTLKNCEEVKDFVKADRNAIGYIDVGDVDGSVKVVPIDGKDKL